MNKKLMGIGIVCIFLLVGIAEVSAIETKNNYIVSQWKNIKVDNEGDGDFLSIQAAINAANPGDIIEVYSGNYPEHITINKQI